VVDRVQSTSVAEAPPKETVAPSRTWAAQAGAVVEYFLIAAGVVSLYFTEHRLSSDGLNRYQALSQLLSGDGLSPDRYQLVGPLFASPMWWLGRLGVLGRDESVWLLYYNLTLFVLCLVGLHVLLRRRIDARLLRRFLLLLVAGSMIPAHITDFYGEVFTAVTVGLGILLAVSVVVSRPWRVVGWIAGVLGTANTPAALPAFGLVGLDQGIARRRLRYAVPVVVAALLVLAENAARRGSPFDQGYSGYAFDYPFLFGVLAIMLSFGKGLVFFAPGMFLPVRRRMEGLYDPERIDLWRAYRSWLLFIAGLVLVYANWWAWNGDTYWGPRFFLFAMFPAALALAIWLTFDGPRPAWTDAVLLVVLAGSIWVGMNATLFELLWPANCYIDHTYCRFAIEDSRLWYPLHAWPGLPAGKWVQAAYFIAAYAWLAAPVVRRLVGSASSGVQRLAAARPWAGWRL
jgi:hypothetical protein